MDFFKIKHIHDFPLDDRDHPLDQQDIPLELINIKADFDLQNKFGLRDDEYDAIDNVSPVIDKQAVDTTLDPEGGQYQDELDGAMGGEDSDGLGLDMGEMDQPLGGAEEGGDESDAQGEDANFQGVIRTVQGANLVYKRQTEDNTFTELWVMNIGKDMKKESKIKRAILAGTDIDAQSQQSEDGKQNVDLYTVGNVQFCEISGLPQ